MIPIAGEGLYFPSFREWHALMETVQQISERQGVLMTRADDLQSEVAANTTAISDLAGKIAALSDDVAREIQQVIDAVGAGADNTAAIDSAIGALRSSRTALADLSSRAASLSTDLRGDDPATPATPSNG